MSASVTRIAMWSGPRNISTAMMRAWENRPDCIVSDEPLYGAWLEHSGADHPMREEIIAAMDCDWRSVVSTLTGPVPGGAPIWYQKHMCHHLLTEMHGDWLNHLNHVFLIREPEAVIRSYRSKHDDLSPQSLGVPQQWALFQRVADASGTAPPVIDSRSFLAAPEAHLRALCERLRLQFLDQMLSWPPGPRDSDGPWAPHWYQSVWRSSGFGTSSSDNTPLVGEAARVADQCRPAYEALYALRLQPAD